MTRDESKGERRADQRGVSAPWTDRSPDGLLTIYEISKRLAAFQSVEDTLPEVIALITRVVPLDSTTLVVEAGGAAAATVWPSARAAPEAQRIAKAHAEASFRYFTELGSESSALSGFADAEGGPGTFAALPLAVAHEGVFGVLQFEGAGLDEPNLAFLNAVANQLAVALSRHYAWRADVEARAEAQRRQADAEAAEVRYRTLVDNLDHAFVWEAEPETLQVTYVSSHIEGMLGYPREHWRATPDVWGRHLHPDDREGVLAVARRVAAQGTSEQVTYRVSSADGRTLWLRTGLHVDEISPGRRLVRGVSVDITPLKDAEEQLRHLLGVAQSSREEAEAANRAKDEFLAILSHELRTPLTAILGWVHLLRGGGLSEAERLRALTTIHRSAVTQSQLVADILDVQMMMSGKLRLEVGPVDLASVVEAAFDTLRPAAEAKDIEVRLLLGEAATISGDPARLCQVVSNLLSNAIKFVPRGGRVEIGLRSTDGRRVEMTVSDDGAGIPPSFLPYVFDRFRQADASRTRRYGGLGLGLAIVSKIVELHGGTITAANRPEGGAVFTVSLPRGDPPGAVQADDQHWDSAPSLDGLRILVVDDAPEDRVVIARVLEASGAEVLMAASSAQALPLLERARPHVVVSDIGMPEEDGYVFLRRLRDLPGDRGGLTPALALTAYATEDDRQRAREAGFQQHLSKPVDPTGLVKLVAGLAGRGSGRDSW